MRMFLLSMTGRGNRTKYVALCFREVNCSAPMVSEFFVTFSHDTLLFVFVLIFVFDSQQTNGLLCCCFCFGFDLENFTHRKSTNIHAIFYPARRSAPEFVFITFTPNRIVYILCESWYAVPNGSLRSTVLKEPVTFFSTGQVSNDHHELKCSFLFVFCWHFFCMNS
eukprot:m.8946 g.8946  ORF g.8946 m.8946 type:complete len:166 (-) comp6783_c0_seq1:519-1016(-)